MEALTRAGRIIGILLIIQMIGTTIVNFVLEAPLFDAQGFLENAATYSQQIAVAVVLGLLMEALWVAIAITAFPILYQRTRTMALWFIALAVVILAVAVVENAAVMSMVSVSEAFAGATAAERAQFETFRVVVTSARNWPHLIARMFDGVAIFAFYAALYRAELVPRVLAGFGLIAVVLQVTGVAMALFGLEVIFPLLAPLGLSLLTLAGWLIAKGFREPPPR